MWHRVCYVFSKGITRHMLLETIQSLSSSTALIGGALIGLAVALLLLTNGRLLGVSGILFGLLMPSHGEVRWRIAFCSGLLAGGGLLALFYSEAFGFATDRSLGAIALAGLLVGFGTRLGNGCTSGHGVCGVSRFSGRSIIATLTFISTGMVTVFAIKTCLGGGI